MQREVFHIYLNSTFKIFCTSEGSRKRKCDLQQKSFHHPRFQQKNLPPPQALIKTKHWIFIGGGLKDIEPNLQ